MNTIVPVGVPQVGCVVLATVGTLGVPAAIFIVTVDAASAVQVLSAVLLTVNV